jgi:hypothetical protein
MTRCDALGAVAVALVAAACSEAPSAAGPAPTDTTPALVASVDIPPNYGIHDTYVRDGIAFVSAWNSGVLIYDVGNGVRHGSPAAPVLVSSVLTTAGQVHSSWWFHNPTGPENRYLFVTQEGPATIGQSSSGDLHVVDVLDLAQPHEVAFFHMDGAGTHNVWMDESAQVLYIAYYNAGVVSLDVSGTLAGDLSGRGIDTIAPGGPGNTYVWGVQLYNGSLYATDMLSGLWQLSATGGHMAVQGGGNNVPDRYGSDLWLAGGQAYTGTWGFSRRNNNLGDAVKVWSLGLSGAPTLVDSAITSGIVTVSDVEVSADGKLLMFTTESGPGQGFYFYSLSNPAHPTFRGKYLVASGVHTATFGYIGGKVYAFGARDPTPPQLVILDVTALDR